MSPKYKKEKISLNCYNFVWATKTDDGGKKPYDDNNKKKHSLFTWERLVLIIIISWKIFNILSFLLLSPPPQVFLAENLHPPSWTNRAEARFVGRIYRKLYNEQSIDISALPPSPQNSFIPQIILAKNAAAIVLAIKSVFFWDFKAPLEAAFFLEIGRKPFCSLRLFARF